MNNKSTIEAAVLNLFKTNANYQLAKTGKSNGNTAPTTAEYQYWVNKALNTNISLAALTAKFNSVYSAKIMLDAGSQRPDYIGQEFTISEKLYPNGLFIPSIEVFFSSKDTITPVSLQILETDNGIPNLSRVVDGSRTTIYPAGIKTTLGYSTPFIFDRPVYLKPGIYIFTIRTNSSNFSLYTSENGKTTLDSKVIVAGSFNGDYLQSYNEGQSWIRDKNKNLCFIIRRCKFATGTFTVDFNTGVKQDYFDTVYLNPVEQNFNTTSISYQLNSVDLDLNNYNTYHITNIEPRKNISLNTSQTLNAQGANVLVTMTNTKDHVSPLLDYEASTLTIQSNIINPRLANSAIYEAQPNNGLALAKYVSKQVTLQDGFESTGMTVYVNVNRPTGTDIDVFVKIQNQYDTNDFVNTTNWIQLSRVQKANTNITYTTDPNAYAEEVYQGLNLTYTANTGNTSITYNTFKKYQVKVVMYSDNTALVPKIKNVREISVI